MTITGTADDDLLLGTPGDDTIEGLDGNDTLIGGEGIDSLNGGEGIDTIDFSDEAAGVIVDLDINSAGGTGTPSQDGAIFDAPPPAGGSPIEEVDDIENIIGSDFNDFLFGNNEVNDIQGGLGDDSIHGFGGADILDGGDGIDTLLFTAAGAGVNIDLAAGTTGPNTTINFENANGSAFDDTITGDDGDNVLQGNDGSDILNGGDGDDTLISDGFDVIDGGAGIDTVDFSGVVDGIEIDLSTPPVAPPVDPDVTILNDGSVDLSGSGAAPTPFELAIGTSQISNQVANAAADPAFPPQDVDIFTITVPAGATLSEVVLSGFESEDDLGFLALVAGDTFPADALAADADTSTFIGQGLFGDGEAPNAVTGTNILPAIATGFDGDVGLGPGAFTFLVQQLGPATLDYTFDFIIEEGEPAPVEPPADPGVTVLNDGSEDLSGSGAAPTPFELAIGTSQLSNQVVNAAADPDLAPPQDVDIFSITVPEGAILSEVVLSGFESTDNVGFLALVEGDTFPADALAGGADTSTFIGQGLFGDDAPPNAVTGTNILPAIATGFDGDAGLGPGTFTFLVQQLGDATIDYTLDFIVEEGELAPVEPAVTVLNDGSEDLSGSGAAPTPFELAIGTSQLSNQVVNAAADPDLAPPQDVDIFSITVPEGAILSEVVLSGFESTDNVGFLALVEGDTFPADALAGGADTSTFIGQGLFGDDAPPNAVTGTNILPAIATGFDGELGLGSGTFTFLVQQLGDATIDYTLDFIVEEADTAVSSLSVDPIGLVGVENIIGSAGDDTIVGDDGDNVLSGGEGIDSLNGGEGIDTLDFSGEAAGVIVDLDIDSAGGTGTPGQDGAIFDAPPPAGGSPIEEVDDFENIIGSDFNDFLFGNNEVNDIQGGLGDDSIHGFGGADILDGGDGIDTLLFTAAGAGVNIDLAAGTTGPNTTIGFENANGSAFNDTITGDDGDNVLFGNAGDDSITGGLGNDTLDGGEGIDIADFTDLDVPVTVDLDAAGNGTVTRETGFALALADVDVDSLNLEAVPDDATFLTEALAGNIYFNIHTNDFPSGEIRGQLDTIVSDETVDGVQTVVLSAGLDSSQEPDPPSDSEATGTGLVTLAVAADGSITYSLELEVAGITVSELLPVAGVSSIHLHNAPAGVNGPVILDVVQDAGGDVEGAALTADADTGDGDVFVQSIETDTLISIEEIIAGEVIVPEVPEIDLFVGSAEDDIILGGVDIDAIDDIVLTGAGDDEVDLPLAAGAANNIVLAGSGADEISSSQDDIIFGGSGDDILDATNSNGGNRISGGAGNDTLILGAVGGDRLLGGDGDDTFLFGEGGAGGNILSGGSGADIFAASPGEVPTEANIITDFDVAEDEFAGVDFADVTLEGSDVLVGGDVLATLLGVDATTLTEANFGPVPLPGPDSAATASLGF